VRVTRSRQVLAHVVAAAGGDSSASEASEASADSADSGTSARARIAQLWRADPVEVLRAWRLRRRPDDLLSGALDLLSAIGAGLEAGLPPARAVEVAATTVVGADQMAGALGAPTARPQGTRPVASATASDHRLLDTPTRGRRPAVAGLAADLVRAGRTVRPASTVWADWSARTSSDELAFVAAAWQLSERTGAPLAAAVERAARGLRDVRRRQGRVSAAVAGPRATVTVLTGLPLAGPLLGLACGVDPHALYLGSPLSTWAVVAGAGLVLLGRWWCTRMVRAVVRS
jgi:tight adherence protein B